MADNWEDEADDWEAEADRLDGIALHAVDESKFAGEDEGAPESWEDAVPQSQPKKAVESRYAARDAADAKRAALGGAVDPADPKAAARAQQDAEARMMAEQLGVSGAPADTPAAALATADPTTKADFEAFAHDIFEALAKPHAGGKQYKGFVKALAKELCGVMEAESVKDVETALAGLRSEKLKAARAAAAQKKTGAKKHVKMEADDIAAGLDDMRYGGAGADADDDFDFM